MNNHILIRVAAVLTFTMVLSAQGLAQSAAPTKVGGLINDYSDTANAAGAWHIVGEWSATLRGHSGRVDFVANLTMVRATSGASPHTHHIAVVGGRVTAIANGYRISGTATITTNGSPAGFSGSHIDVDVTGGSMVPLSNVKLTFSDGAVAHFGAEPLDGMITLNR